MTEEERALAAAWVASAGCRGMIVGLVVGSLLWVVVLVPLILWGPL